MSQVSWTPTWVQPFPRMFCFQLHLRVCAGATTHPQGRPRVLLCHCHLTAGPSRASSWPHPDSELCGTCTPGPVLGALLGQWAHWARCFLAEHSLGIPGVPQVSVVSTKQGQLESRQWRGHSGAQTSRGCCRGSAVTPPCSPRLPGAPGTAVGTAVCRGRSPEAQGGHDSAEAAGPAGRSRCGNLRKYVCIDAPSVAGSRPHGGPGPQTWVTTVGWCAPHALGRVGERRPAPRSSTRAAATGTAGPCLLSLL